MRASEGQHGMKHRFCEYVRFCPKCGVESLERDRDRIGNEKEQRQLKNGSEWWCRTCGFSFGIMKSTKWCTADDLHRRDRALRNNVRFSSDSIAPEVVKAYNEAGQSESDD